ncbi:histidine phosphotransferase family protein [Tropicimonas sp. TH_r6]|uniref:histidine phosphotransferase family protein n=1 Tax=Tropicimonas sp. TH_r6 TaxID=3082085 RepID=UPI002952AF7B|nr:histidine phosphotransferase family protein [Tropicimonas sp. TH_r6]MDV7141741.1 histidine phosphotransferase family protein [Tropicimonas sp. TH_r6]
MSSDEPTTVDLASLIGSRICHDLISPIGAIGNGLELLSMSGTGGPEVALITDSVANANARIRFFRIAFGYAAPEQGSARSEITAILQDVYGQTRLKVDWNVPGDCRRQEAKAAFLALQCLETALPFGGEVSVSRGDGAWHFTGRSQKMKFDPELWTWLSGEMPGGELAPKHVHFALLPAALAGLGRSVTQHQDDTMITLSF